MKFFLLVSLFMIAMAFMTTVGASPVTEADAEND